MKLFIETGSDDQIYVGDGHSQEFHYDGGTKQYELILPDGLVVPIEVDFISRGWAVRLDLPEGTIVRDPDGGQGT